ncbi:MAG TPA: amidohydrolase family protein [Novosphingobium sp.]|nr:amidohydrolase family protein [Novosphingobium sp.]
MKAVLAAALLAFPLSGPLFAPLSANAADRTPPSGTLIDDVDGITLDDKGAVTRFTGLLVGEDGTIREVYSAKDKRPKRVAYKLEGKGRVLVPGLIDSHMDVMALGLALLIRSGGGTERTPEGKPRPEDRDVAFAKAQELLLAHGVTAVADMGTTIETWQTYRRAGDSGRLRLRVIAYAAGVEAMALIGGPAPTPWLYQGRLRQNGVLLALNGPDGKPRMTDDQLRNLMSRGAIDNFQIAIRADGPSATVALDAIAELSQTYKGDRRWRIEGISTLDPGAAGRFGPGGTIATTFSGNSAGATALREIAAGTGRVTSGTGDSPAQPLPDPLFGMAAGLSTEGPTREQAFAALTTAGAYALFAEDRLGRIAKGLRADFLFVDRDPLLASTALLRGTRVLETWIEGRKVYDAAQPKTEEKTGPAMTPEASRLLGR